jgi:two-component sensor histidine kinase
MKAIIATIIFLAASTRPVKSQPVDNLLSGLRTDRDRADTLFSVAMKQFYRHRMDSAVYYLNAGKGFAEKTSDNSYISRYYQTLANSLLYNGKTEEGLSAIKRSGTFLSASSPYDLRMKYLMFNGILFEQLHKTDSAVFYFRQCELLNNKEDPYKNWLVYSQLAQMYERADNYTEAEKYYQLAYDLSRSRGIRLDYGPIIYQFADLYYKWGKVEKFAAMMKDQEQFIKSGKKDYTKDPSHSLYFVDWEKQPFNKKVEFMENVKQKFLAEHSYSYAGLANLYLAGFYEQENQPETALKYALENKTLLTGRNELVNQYTSEKMAYRLLKKTGRLKEALVEADTLFALKDSIIRLQHSETMLDAEAKYETQQKEKDIALLNSENQLALLRLTKERDLKTVLIRENLLKDSVVDREKEYNKLLASENDTKKSQLAIEQALKATASRENELKRHELVREKRIRLQLIIGAVLLLFASLAIFLLYRRQRSKNLLIQRQADDLQVLMKEIHHRVKNNLQVISSLLDLQSLTIGDQQASQAIKESRNRVYSMALIHQNLYNEQNLMSIEMDDYINKLCQSLFASYNASENKIILETDVDPVLLDVDMVIPVGLVLNELISNALKYAFCDKEQGVLRITFKNSEDGMLLQVRDNGKGFPKGMNIYQSPSFGYKLIKAFAQKLKAKLEVYNDDGACVMLHIRKMKAS